MLACVFEAWGMAQIKQRLKISVHGDAYMNVISPEESSVEPVGSADTLYLVGAYHNVNGDLTVVFMSRRNFVQHDWCKKYPLSMSFNGL